jgi:dTDP-4-dehydrorhamnose reductase/beta-phosphoglucomutase-like phosphatase (HAD superfamily)
MTILVCGASGLVGTELCSILSSKNIPFIGTYNSNKLDGANMIKLNYLSLSEIENVILKHNITSCVFLVVQRITDICENDWNATKTTNIEMVNNTAFICSKFGVKFIHLSTDYVFDGASQPNLTDSQLNPLQNYGISKLISELKVQSHKGEYCIIRTPVLYGDKCKIHENAVTLIAKNVMNFSEKIPPKKEDHYSIRRPLHVYDLSLFILQAIKNDYRGIYHFYNPYNKFTKYEMCIKIAEILNVPTTNIIANSSVKLDCIANRPYDTMLSDDKYNIHDIQFVDFDLSIKQYFEKYSHYGKLDKDCFVMVDLDGTLIDSSEAHYNAYKSALSDIGLSFINFTEWKQIISTSNINNYFASLYDSETIIKIRSLKKQNMISQKITYTKNSNLFLQYLMDNDIQFVVVTNTDSETVEIIKSILPFLKNVKNWITRDDYENAKPSDDSYRLALTKYYSNERYIIGIEDSMVGYNALKSITDRIYIYCENDCIFSEQDCYIFNNFVNLY